MLDDIARYCSATTSAMWCLKLTCISTSLASNDLAVFCALRDLARKLIDTVQRSKVFSPSPQPRKPNVNRDVLVQNIFRLLDDCFPATYLQVQKLAARRNLPGIEECL